MQVANSHVVGTGGVDYDSGSFVGTDAYLLITETTNNMIENMAARYFCPDGTIDHDKIGDTLLNGAIDGVSDLELQVLAKLFDNQHV